MTVCGTLGLQSFNPLWSEGALGPCRMIFRPGNTCDPPPPPTPPPDVNFSVLPYYKIG